MADSFLWAEIFMLIFMIMLFTLGNLLVENFGSVFGLSGGKNTVASLIGLGDEISKWPNVIWYTILPMMATLAILYGLLEELKLFRGPSSTYVYVIIGITWSFLLMYTGMLKIISIFLFQLGAFIAVLMFGLVFIAGTFIWGYGRLGSAKRELIGMSDTGSSKGLKRALAKDLATIRTMGAKKLLTADALKADNNRTQYIKLRDDFLSNYNELKIKLSGSLTGKDQDEIKKLWDIFDPIRKQTDANLPKP